MKIKMFVYRGVRIYKMSPNFYRLTFGKDVATLFAPYTGGIAEVIGEIDELISIAKGGRKWQA